MMNLLGCTKEKFYQLMTLMNYKKDKNNDEIFAYKGNKKEKKFKRFVKKSNNPFSKLETLSFK